VTRIAVIGIGQSLRGDDGVGLAAVREWQARFKETATRPEVRCEACEVPGLALLDVLCDVESAILVDAIQSSHPPGTIHVLREETLATFTSGANSAHGWGVAETLRLRAQLNDAPVDIHIIGIEAHRMDLGAGLSDEIQSALPMIGRVIEETVQSLLK
jgi:hydrogenase maturation protease